MQSNNLEKLIFVNKNCPNDAKASYKTPHNLIDLIDFEINLEQEWDELEDSFEWDALKEDWSNFLILYILKVWSHICV